LLKYAPENKSSPVASKRRMAIEKLKINYKTQSKIKPGPVFVNQI
jgi:hypothetical protein